MHKQIQHMSKQLQPQAQYQQFRLKKQIRKRQAEMLIYLYNSDMELTFQRFQEKIALYTQLKKYKRKIVLKNQEVKWQFQAMSERLHQKVLRVDAQCQKQLNRLETSYQVKKVDYFHRFYVQRSINSTYSKNYQILIKNQYHLIKQQQHVYFSILKAIWARQICLGLIKTQLKHLSPSDMYQHFNTVKQRQSQLSRRVQQRNYKIHNFRAKLHLDQKQLNLNKTKIQILFSQIQNYRQLTYHLIELIKNWKLYIISLTHDDKLRKEKMSFYYKENNILLYILNDTSFISTSFLANFYQFAIKNDPFLLKPIFYFEKKQQNNKVLDPQQQQLKKLINIKPVYINSIISGIHQLYYQILSYSQTRLTDRSPSFSNLKYNNHIQSQKQLIFNRQDLKVVHEDQIYKIKNTMKRYQSQSFKKNNPSIKKPKEDLTKNNIMKSYKSQKQKIGLMNTNLRDSMKIEKDSLESFMKNRSSVISRDTQQKIKFNNQMTTFYGFRKTNPQQHMLEHSQLAKLKQQVYLKIKQQFQYQTKKQLLQSTKFQQLIDSQLKSKMLKLLDEDKQRIQKQQLQITPLSFSEEEIKTYIAYTYKQIMSVYSNMQIEQNMLMKRITDIQYCYILKVHNKFGECANVIATINRQVTDYKSIKIQLISFKYKQILQKIILKVIQFYWKFQNCKQIIISFDCHPQISQQKQLIDLLKIKLALNCNIIQKNHRDYTNYKFIFIRNHLSQTKKVFNPFPQQIFFQIYAIVCTQPLQLTTNLQNSLQKRLYYDFIMVQILRKYTNSQDFLTLRSKFKNKDRFWYLINQMSIIQDIQNQKVNLQCLQSQTMSQLNYKLRLLKKPSLQVVDINTFNSIRMIQIQYNLSIAYQMKVLANENGQKYHRYAIKNDVDYMIDNNKTLFYRLPVKQLKHLRIILFSAQNYFQYHHTGLNMYLLDLLEQNKDKWGKKHVENLWIQMLRYPSNGSQKQIYNLNTSKCDEFKCIDKELYIGDRFQWFTDIQIQNGISYRFKEGDIYMKKPLGIGVITNKNILIYSRILGQENS